MLWLTGLWLLVFASLYWRRYFWLAGYLLLGGGGLLAWRGFTSVIWPGLQAYQVLFYSVASGVFWLVGYLFWRFAHGLLQRRGENLAYRSLQLVALILLLLPVITIWWRSKLVVLLWLSIGYFAVGLGTYVLGTLLLMSYPQQSPQYVIVLGSGLQPNGQLTSTLKRRVQRAAQIYQQRKCYLVLSGGQGSDEPLTEAQAMANVLLKLGVPAAQLILEDRSTSTLENLQFSLAKLPTNSTIGVLTSDFHLLRAALYGRRLGLHLSYYVATTSWTYLPLGALRDYLALLVMTRWWQFLGWLAVMLVYIR
ncbi:YdcF family protein [Loigolactobacillus jiayinensis]|uniref:YdcF family protein n=1 Tax=Loigolactobacillus jiayinensis TaxID=2486016 RepID=A0ABW1RIS5_9LACO|nr:YdcF family protein [Loigolactobacillus jiayinensis]